MVDVAHQQIRFARVVEHLDEAAIQLRLVVGGVALDVHWPQQLGQQQGQQQGSAHELLPLRPSEGVRPHDDGHAERRRARWCDQRLHLRKKEELHVTAPELDGSCEEQADAMV